MRFSDQMQAVNYQAERFYGASENSLGFCCEDRKLQGCNLRSQEQFCLKNKIQDCFLKHHSYLRYYKQERL